MTRFPDFRQGLGGESVGKRITEPKNKAARSKLLDMPEDRIHRKGIYLLTGLTLCLALACPHQAAIGAAGRLEFSLYRNDGSEPGNTMLVVGGIQGDEPGGFNAASLLVTHYRFTRGTVWVVPNLNFESIVKRSRGIYGDMNRKFPAVSPSDPDFERVEKIKRIITDQQLGLDEIFLRMGVSGGGCSGFSYLMTFDKDIKDDDETADYEGLKVLQGTILYLEAHLERLKAGLERLRHKPAEGAAR